MHAKKHICLHWVLIIALAILPIRAALAVNPGCSMHEHGDSASSMNLHPGHMAMRGHTGHPVMNHAGPTIAGADNAADASMDQPTIMQNCCCCDADKAGCSSDCSMGLHASAIISTVFSLTASFQSLTVAAAADALHTRELTPPSRPPLSLHV